jgi:hypothetical protein
MNISKFVITDHIKENGEIFVVKRIFFNKFSSIKATITKDSREYFKIDIEQDSKIEKSITENEYLELSKQKYIGLTTKFRSIIKPLDLNMTIYYDKYIGGLNNLSILTVHHDSDIPSETIKNYISEKYVINVTDETHNDRYSSFNLGLLNNIVENKKK